ncbi:hypothetical protein [Solitalea koreensis]|uniref:Uncharacterized protein n=1 Tax=Solitalea koreensis TaxID=543615 RepID=A0A521BMT5_9SPHI|nr:hypothetical protein [Solitalea koreensis]SMO48081.1 hypothetical protein SAMN06265350_102322 [Solitalea koreensis]
MATFSIGTKTFKLGAIAVDGGMGTVLTSPGDVRENTIRVTQGDFSVNNIMAEGKSSPVYVTQKNGETTLEFDLLTHDPDVMMDLMGGTVTGTDPNKIWNAPELTPIIEKSFEITDLQDSVWQFPRVQVMARIQGVFTRDEVNVIKVKGVVLQPTKTATSPISYGKPV